MNGLVRDWEAMEYGQITRFLGRRCMSPAEEGFWVIAGFWLCALAADAAYEQGYE